jgi:hypothetical protein
MAARRLSLRRILQLSIVVIIAALPSEIPIPASAHIEHFSHYLQLNDNCYPQNCPNFLAVTKRKDGTKDFVYVELRVQRSNRSNPDFFDSKVCYGTCSVVRESYGNYPAKHNRTYTVSGLSGHACGHSDSGDDDCRYFSDYGSYDASAVCMMAFFGVTGHCHQWSGR